MDPSSASKANWTGPVIWGEKYLTPISARNKQHARLVATNAQLIINLDNLDARSLALFIRAIRSGHG